MSHRYVAVQWNRHKIVYDLVAGVSVVLLIGAVVVGAKLGAPAGESIGDEILIMRALGIAGLVLLHIILAIGPLARLDRRLLPLLYNRRHLGVMMFLVGLAHAALSLLYYGGFGNTDPINALLGEPGFATPGAVALVILFLMAATSHDFWLKNLGPVWWKTLHMGVYAAYALLVLHVAWGSMQDERSVALPAALGSGVVLLASLHALAGLKQMRLDSRRHDKDGGWIDVGEIDDIEPQRALPVCLADGRRIAVFRYERDGEEVLSATDGVCAHQGGPLDEGKVIDGCATCPWHGYQYLPDKGQSPPPFTEKLATYEVRISAGRIEVNPSALAAGTPIEPARIGGHE